MDISQVDVSVKQHHIQAELCRTRARYREGRRLKAVKVYTVNQESKCLLIQGIPSVGAHGDLVKMFASYGHLEDHKFLDEYPAEKFTEVLLIKYKQIQAARIAKRKLDDFNFFGGTLHVCYAPEYESVQDTREKLEDRRKAISARIRKLEEEKNKPEDQAEVKGKTERVPPRHSQTRPPLSPSVAVLEDESHELAPACTSTMSRKFLEPPSENYWNSGANNTREPSRSAGDAINSQMVVHDNESHEISDASVSNTHGFDERSHYSAGAPRTIYPSQDQDHYKGPHRTPTLPEKIKSGKQDDPSTEKLIVKQFKSKTASTPKFVPRQVNRNKVFVRRTGEKTTQATVKTDITPDPINDRLRSEALKLGKPTGPNLPPEENEQRKSFKRASTMGDETLEKTTLEIRDKVKKFCEIAVPVQVKKRKRR